MSRIAIWAVAACLTGILLVPAEAARKRVQVPDKYDGSWSITAVTENGPCSASTSYQVQIQDSHASIPGDDMNIDGGVSMAGAVEATITQGSNKVPITGSLTAKGSGSGTWRASGGLVECSGNWSARRAG
ncbi:heme utilization protein [Methylobacterium sp. E-025]|uniref:heme utilization protein n=1 Tax=unclassified Methylobacterium TaxID=2615210 RepID=UPI001FBBC373|nr:MULTISPECIES: heme utilization protein [unclassified Methylobacterium]MCJ2039053.1 heme utilization protein [Methylobacterium sp. J-059]MCJ2109982.1 heme utilization protein [Methylobacterium sp. E-025]